MSKGACDRCGAIGPLREAGTVRTDPSGSRRLCAAGCAPLTPAERQALDALHVWLHHPCGDDELIEACADFHGERSRVDCQLAEFAVEKDIGPGAALARRGEAPQ